MRSAPGVVAIVMLAAIAVGADGAGARAAPRRTVAITWLVSPAASDGTQSVAVEIAGHRFALGRQLGALVPHDEPVCARVLDVQYPLARDEVAALVFYEGGAGGFVVHRRGARLVLASWEQSDGACPGPHGEPAACPRREQPIRTIAIAAGARVIEQVMRIDAHGTRTPLACTR